MIWRVICSEVTRGQSYHEIVTLWSLNDLDDANCVIDAHELAHMKAQAAQQQQQAQGKR